MPAQVKEKKVSPRYNLPACPGTSTGTYGAAWVKIDDFMKPLQILGILALLILGVIVTDTSSSDNTMDVSRYFYKGDGRLNLVNAKNKISFNG